MIRPDKWSATNLRTRLVLIAGVAAMCALLCRLEGSRLASARSALATKTTRLAEVRRDLQRIRALQTAPRRATDRRMPHDALIAIIDQSQRSAGVDAKSLSSVWPESPRRVGQSDYLRLTTRLSFERVTLEQVARFVHVLNAADRSLTLTSVRLLSQQYAQPFWDAELAVTYSIYAPRPRTTSSERKVSS